MKTVVVIGGGSVFKSHEAFLETLKTWTFDPDGAERRDWKRNLQEQLGDGYRVLRPSMPNKLDARYDAWSIWFEKVMEQVEGPVTLVGHSLGGMFLLKYLSHNTVSNKVEALHSVASPYDSDEHGELQAFALPEDLSGVAEQCRVIHLYHSQDDPTVPIGEFDEIVKRLPSTTVHRLNGRGHIRQETFPELEAHIKNTP